MSGVLSRLFGRPSRADLFEGLARRARKRARDLERDLLARTTELALTRQARDRADADAIYWRTRAERFMDQIGLREGILAAPAMSEPAPGSPDTLGGLFGALSRSEINTESSGAAATSAAVLGVNPDAARAAIDEFKATTVRP